MQNTTQLNHHITVLDAHYIAEGIACIYIIVQNKKATLIETGTFHSITHILKALKQLGLTVNDVSYVIPTHIHLDHAAGAGELLTLCPNAKLVIHPRGASHLINPERLEAGTMAVYGKETYRKLYGKLKPIQEKRVIIAEDGYELNFNGRKLNFIDTPGHALHHFCIHDPQSQGVFTGDTFGVAYKQLANANNQFIFATTTPTQFDPDALINSIKKIVALNPQHLYLTHFGKIPLTQTTSKQLIQSIHTFTQIAKQQQTPIEGRVKRIEDQLMHWLLTQYKQTTGKLSLENVEKLLKTDTHLNAQGLDVWLKRLEKST